MEFVLILIVALAVVYKLGLFGPILDLSAVATRESAVYNREHKTKVAKRYLNKDSSFTEDEVTAINDNIKAIDSLKFD